MRSIIEKMKDSKKYWDVLACIGMYKDDFVPYGIHAIDYEDAPERMTVTIYLEYPGMFIGRKGDHIKSVEAKMTDKFEKKASIRIEEFIPVPLMTKERFEEL